VQNPTEYLRYEFTDTEIADAARDLATANRKRTSLEQRKKEVDSAIKAEIEAENSIIARLSQLIGTGYEYRDIEVRIELDTPEAGKKRIVRLDTGEEVAVKFMTESEKQMCLDLQTKAEAEEEAAREAAIKAEQEKAIVTPPPVLKALGEDPDSPTATLSILQPDGTYRPIAEVTDIEGPSEGAPLASASAMGTGTHQKKGKRGKEAAAGESQ
jgi:hypothetical protein